MTATLTLRTQSSGLRPQVEHVLTSQRPAVKSEPTALSRRSRQISERELMRMRLSWDDMNTGQLAQLDKAFADASGPVLSMNYTPVGDVDANAIEVCFVEDSYSVRQKDLGSFQVSIEIEESR